MGDEEILASEESGADLTPAAEKDAVNESLFFQYEGKSTDMEEIIDRCVSAWKNTSGEDAKLETMDIYLKPEEGKSYYVINSIAMGAVDI